MAATGQRGEDVRPTNRFTPFLNGSVFDCLIVTRSIAGWVGSSIAMSPTHKWTAGSNSLSDGTVISPARRKAKKHKQQAAQTILESRSPPDADHTSFKRTNKGGVMGRRSRGPTPFSASRFIPRSTYSNLDIGGPPNGSGWAAEICKCLIADKYTFTVQYLRP